MGWCFLQLLTRKPDNTLLTFNKNVKQTQFNLSYMIQYASLELKFDGHRRRKYLATPGQFTLVIAPSTTPICHNLLNQYLYVADYGPNGIPDVAQNAVHACFAEQAMHNLSFVMRHWSGTGDENGLCPDILGEDMPVEGGIPHCPVVFVNPNRVGELVEPFPLPRPYYTGLVWPATDCAELAHHKHFPSFYAQMVNHMDTMGDNTMILKGPNIGALTDAVIILCIYYAQTAWDDEKQVFHQSIEDWQGPQFQSSEITCDNWSEPARFGQMRIVVDRCRSYGEGINKMVFREVLIKALRDTDLYVNLPNNSAYFTAKFPMTDPMESPGSSPCPVHSHLSHATSHCSYKIDIGLVATDTFCSKRCDWGFGKDPNGHDLPMYISAKQAFKAALYTYFEHDLNGCGMCFLEITTSLPYMPCSGSSIKIQFQPPNYDDPPSQTFHISTCFTLVKIKLDVVLCRLLASSATDVFPN
ncbi:hypothetical protein EDD18DRAFT_1109254 [Armillaria luteobubalina]|uniref:Uncharacterized protein n=1 Tax=Armillaria luteobubalina TaxID=153913 RepID=A0AA39PX27_9AGAR|nr:hypothetical protein EDD18DRAFT_1109254 [Armillaria luteobubalina]